MDPIDEELAADSGHAGGCLTCAWLNGEHPDAPELRARIGRYPASAIFRAMKRRGFSGGISSVLKHARERHA